MRKLHVKITIRRTFNVMSHSHGPTTGYTVNLDICRNGKSVNIHNNANKYPEDRGEDYLRKHMLVMATDKTKELAEMLGCDVVIKHKHRGTPQSPAIQRILYDLGSKKLKSR